MGRKSKKEKKYTKNKDAKTLKADAPETPAEQEPRKFSNKEFNAELEKLQGELVKLQYWVKDTRLIAPTTSRYSIIARQYSPA